AYRYVLPYRQAAAGRSVHDRRAARKYGRPDATRPGAVDQTARAVEPALDRRLRLGRVQRRRPEGEGARPGGGAEGDAVAGSQDGVARAGRGGAGDADEGA